MSISHIAIKNITNERLIKEMKELCLSLCLLLLVSLVYGQEPTNRPSNGK